MPLGSSTAPFSRSLSLPNSPTASAVVPVLALNPTVSLPSSQAVNPVAASAAAAAAGASIAPSNPVVTLTMPKVRAVKNKAPKRERERDSDGGCSPRGRKRTAGRIAANPNGHSCTQCGTQVSMTLVGRAGAASSSHQNSYEDMLFVRAVFVQWVHVTPTRRGCSRLVCGMALLQKAFDHISVVPAGTAVDCSCSAHSLMWPYRK